MAWFRSSSVEQAQAPASEAGPEIRSHRADYRRSAIPLHPCHGVSLDSVDRSSVDARARDWIPTPRGVKMSGGTATHFNYMRDTLAGPTYLDNPRSFPDTSELPLRIGMGYIRAFLAECGQWRLHE